MTAPARQPIIFNDYAEVVDFVLNALQKFENQLHGTASTHQLSTQQHRPSIPSRSATAKQSNGRSNMKPHEAKRESVNQLHVRPDNRHHKCMSNINPPPPSFRPQLTSHSPQPPDRLKPTKSIYERSTETVETHRRQMFVQHVKKLLIEDSQRSKRPSRTHSRSQSRNSNPSQSKKQTLNPENILKDVRSKKFVKLLEELPKNKGLISPQKSKKKLNLIAASPSNPVSKGTSDNRSRNKLSPSKMHLRTEAIEQLRAYSPTIKITEPTSTIKRTPIKRPAREPSATASKSPLRQPPKKQSFEKTLTHDELTSLLGRAQRRITNLAVPNIRTAF